ncbi:MAG TPA: DUF4272 domain-containing protein [Natronosporangium sp.]|nr:DUF4272 domain-containing protein [Natronosporangium sp.]
MTVPAPDPLVVRSASLRELDRLRLPLPPRQFPLVWQAGDGVALRSTLELEARAAVLNVVLARCYGMPPQAAMSWLLSARLVEAVTKPEWQFVVAGKGDRRALTLHLEAIYGLTWLLGMTSNLEPTEPATEKLVDLLPDLPRAESMVRWRSRTLSAPRDAATAAAMLDRYYCLDWAYQEAQRRRMPLPGMIDANAVGQRRWALEWAVTFIGPYHGTPREWEEIDLSTWGPR